MEEKNTTTMRGHGGEVRWGYHIASTLKSWTLAAEPAGGTLTAEVVSHDAYRVSQQPLTFVVPRPHGQWSWPVQSLQITGTSLRATLGPQE